MRSIGKFFDDWLVGYFDSNLQTDEWKAKFENAPTWYDADMSLQQMKLGNAVGSRCPLLIRAFIQRLLFHLGCFIHRFWYLTLIFGLLLMSSFLMFLGDFQTETDLVKLWVPSNGRLFDELKYREEARARALKSYGPFNEGENYTNSDELFNHQLIIQIGKKSGENVLTKEHLLKHLKLFQKIATLSFESHGRNWTLDDFCYKAKLPDNTKHLSLLEDVLPCASASPLDCFWEGGKALGPYKPVQVPPLARIFVSSLPRGNVTWANLNVAKIVKEVGDFINIDDDVLSFIERAKFDAGYVDRPCIDPLDEECPTTAPNYFAICDIFDDFIAWNRTNNMKIHLKPTINAGKIDKCLNHQKSFREWIRNNENLLKLFVEPNRLPKYPDYGEILSKGCNGLAKTLQIFPAPMLIGGVSGGGDENSSQNGGKPISAEALQTIFFTMLKNGVQLRAIKTGRQAPPPTNLSLDDAAELLVKWQHKFVELVDELNRDEADVDVPMFHPLTMTSMESLLDKFTRFNYSIIVTGYVLMILYAMSTQFHYDHGGLSIDSNMALIMFGILFLTFSSICGLGFSTMIGIHFNVATTQIVPFLTLSIGVDDLFLMLHSYNQIVEICDHNEIGTLLKETGMSVAMTSLINIMAFMSSYVIPIAALRAFVAQTSILLAFNLFYVLFVFTSMMVLDLKRKKSRRRDIVCCFKSRPTTMPTTTTSSSKSSSSERTPKRTNHCWGLKSFVNNFYIPLLNNSVFKTFVIVASVIATLVSLHTLKSAELGLELSDVVPNNTTAANYIRVSRKYFSFFPLDTVIRAIDIDVPNQQLMLDNFHRHILKTKYVMNHEQLKSSSWLEKFREWIRAQESNLKKALIKNEINMTTGNPIRRRSIGQIAARMICSFGTAYNCTNRLGHLRMINDCGVIRPDAFYNYLTAWYNLDNGMFDGDLRPFPPLWQYNSTLAAAIPPAARLFNAKLSFYQTNLVDTPAILEMIDEVRTLMEHFNALGFSTHPSSPAFTFWEQYHSLTENVTIAIGISSLAGFFVFAIVFVNIRAGLMIFLIIVVTTVELAGLMHAIGVKINPISAVILICTVGMSVEFTAHVLITFLTAIGSRRKRLETCLQHMFVPVFHGAFSTFVALLMLAFSEFDFIIKYFFGSLMLLAFLGVFNGLCLFPILLTILGPDEEIAEIDGNERLEPPPGFSDRIQLSSIETE